MQTVIIKNLNKSFRNIQAIKDISLNIEKGKITGLIGADGSGKTTLIRLISGLLIPNSGEISVLGINPATEKEKLNPKIGYMPQKFGLYEDLTVEENLTLPLLLDGRKPNKEQIDYLVSNLGLGDRLKHLPNQLSGGQQQRVSIGRALANNPALLLADEPTGNLDSENSKEIVALLRKFNREHNQTVIMITHDERIAQSADRIIAIEDGKIVKDEVSKGWIL